MSKKDLIEKAEKLADEVGDIFTKETTEIEVVMSVLVSMLVSTAIGQANMTPIELVRLFSQAVEKYDGANKEMEKDDGEVISRTTH